MYCTATPDVVPVSQYHHSWLRRNSSVPGSPPARGYGRAGPIDDPDTTEAVPATGSTHGWVDS